MHETLKQSLMRLNWSIRCDLSAQQIVGFVVQRLKESRSEGLIIRYAYVRRGAESMKHEVVTRNVFNI